jgi:hypothetical protein
MLPVVELAAGTPHMWRVTLHSGAEIELWADGYTTEPVDGHWVFDVLADAKPQERRMVRIGGEAAPPSHRCLVVVARVPVTEVRSIEGGWPLPDNPGTAPTDNAI